MQNTAHLHNQQSASGLSDNSLAPSGLTLVEPDQNPAQLVGISAAWRKLIMQADMAAPHLQVATIEGEHGTGKNTLARYLYQRSPVRSSNFQRRDAREWLATDADPATLAGFTYLDRVDLLAPPGQGLLLGVLRSLQDRPPGRAVILASSQTPLRQMVGQGLLLPDLAFRLTAIRFAIQPLRMRREDIGPLAQALLDRLCLRYQQRPVILGPGALACLLQHNWPGNVRELASALETALLEADNGVIRPADFALPENSRVFGAQPSSNFPLHADSGLGSGLGAGLDSGFDPIFDPVTGIQLPAQTTNLSLDSVIRHHVQYVLDLNGGNKLRTARQLAISRSTLYRILANESLVAQ
jgi:DNA-binding NtrC family response regulator